MTFESQILRDASNGQVCVRCGKHECPGGAHYTGFKCHDFLTADLCRECHVYMDRECRSKEEAVEHSEEFQHLVILTLERRFVQGTVIVKGMREPRIIKLSKIVPRRMA
jgi:hypothetical protein